MVERRIRQRPCQALGADQAVTADLQRWRSWLASVGEPSDGRILTAECVELPGWSMVAEGFEECGVVVAHHRPESSLVVVDVVGRGVNSLELPS